MADQQVFIEIEDKQNGQDEIASHTYLDMVNGNRVLKAVSETDDNEDDEDNGDGTRSRSPNLGFENNNNLEYVEVDGVQMQVPDVNAYQHKKTLAQGMMDLALLSANANQLRYVLETYSRHPYFYSSLIFISLSILFQIAVGVGLILNSQYNVNDQKEICRANKVSNYTIIGIFIVTVINVFISSFGVADPLPS